ncbi:hypothetical protein BK772_16475 [Bacillus thuringiensis serovar finitimus]|uniref:Uncharacterized protein n=1 Tax=Bacillus thuringiensis subsp. finitimus TaxID=29337 RepID=A0A243GHL5_BACTF|nr:hypothetical protein BK772_16475 [Bacillus thuringiensis serovar finitimus]
MLVSNTFLLVLKFVIVLSKLIPKLIRKKRSLFNMLYIKNYNITYNKKRRTLHVGESTITNK